MRAVSAPVDHANLDAVDSSVVLLAAPRPPRASAAYHAPYSLSPHFFVDASKEDWDDRAIDDPKAMD
jgi:hypothetical protein